MAAHELVPQIGGLSHSSTIGQLAGALAEAHKKFKPLKKETVNPFYKSKYADLAAVIEATDEALSANGLAIIQPPTMASGSSVTVTTMLVHSSGEWIRADLSMPTDKANAQGIGSAMTYARRYAYQAFVSVAAEMDDDGNAASGKDVKEATMPKPPKKETAPKPNGEESFKVKFWRQAKGTGKTEDDIRKYIGFLGYEHTEEIPPKLQPEALQWAAEAQ